MLRAWGAHSQDSGDLYMEHTPRWLTLDAMLVREERPTTQLVETSPAGCPHLRSFPNGLFFFPSEAYVWCFIG